MTDLDETDQILCGCALPQEFARTTELPWTLGELTDLDNTDQISPTPSRPYFLSSPNLTQGIEPLWSESEDGQKDVREEHEEKLTDADVIFILNETNLEKVEDINLGW